MNRRSGVRVIPLGGFGEIGKNCFALETQRDMILIDCGVMFPRIDEYPGIDFLVPDFSYVLRKKRKLRGLIVTHAHEDHIGAIPFLLKELKQKIDIYASNLTVAMIKRKLEQYDLQQSANMIEITACGPEAFRLGSDFEVEPFCITHSIPDAVGYAIKTPVGLILHTGDFKFDNTPVIGKPTDFQRLIRFSREGVLALICDTTSVVHKGLSGSERRIGENLSSLIEQARNRRVIVTTFASNLHRIKSIADAAIENGRKIALSGRSVQEGVIIGLQTGHLDVPAKEFILTEELEQFEPSKVLILTTGCQGEPTSSLYRASIDENREFSISPNDYVIFSSKPIPGNEKYVNRIINNLIARGVHVIHPGLGYDVHVSGHGYEDDISWMITLVRPKYLIPYHGEEMQLAAFKRVAKRHGYTDEEIIVLKLGTSVELYADGWSWGKNVPTGVYYVDGLSIDEIDERTIGERIHLQNEGIVIAVVELNEKKNMLTAIELITRGFLCPDMYKSTLKKVREYAQTAIQEFLMKNNYEQTALRAFIKETLSQYFFDHTKRRPMIVPIVLDNNSKVGPNRVSALELINF